MSIRTMRRLGAVGVLAGAALVLAACADDGDDPGTDPGGNQTDTNGDSTTEFPTRAMTYVVPYNPGGSSDPVGREFSRLLSQRLGVDITVQNLPGGDETIGLTYVFQAEPDGHTLGLSSATGFVVAPMGNPDLLWDGPDGFTPLVKTVALPTALVVAADSPYETLDDLIEDARARPGEVRIGSTGRVGFNSFTVAGLEDLADIEVTLIAFSGGAGEAVLATLSGEIEAAVPSAPGQIGLIEAGELRVLGHTGTSDYNEAMGGGPSFEELGYDLPYSADYVDLAPAGLPDDVYTQLVDAAYEVLTSDEWTDWATNQGYISTPMRGEELDQWIADIIVATERGMELIDARTNFGER